MPVKNQASDLLTRQVNQLEALVLAGNGRNLFLNLRLKVTVTLALSFNQLICLKISQSILLTAIYIWGIDKKRSELSLFEILCLKSKDENCPPCVQPPTGYNIARPLEIYAF